MAFNFVHPMERATIGRMNRMGLHPEIYLGSQNGVPLMSLEDLRDQELEDDSDED